jgi:hypothetical protein
MSAPIVAGHEQLLYCCLFYITTVGKWHTAAIGEVPFPGSQNI